MIKIGDHVFQKLFLSGILSKLQLYHAYIIVNINYYNNNKTLFVTKIISCCDELEYIGKVTVHKQIQTHAYHFQLFEKYQHKLYQNLTANNFIYTYVSR
jgi:hypothetical protein